MAHSGINRNTVQYDRRNRVCVVVQTFKVFFFNHRFLDCTKKQNPSCVLNFHTKYFTANEYCFKHGPAVFLVTHNLTLYRPWEKKKQKNKSVNTENCCTGSKKRASFVPGGAVYPQELVGGRGFETFFLQLKKKETL